MDIDSIIVLLETELGKADSLYLNLHNPNCKNSVISLLSDKANALYRKLLEHKSLIYDEDIAEKNIDKFYLINTFGVSSDDKKNVDQFVDCELYLSLLSLSYRIAGEKQDQEAPLFFIPVKLVTNGDKKELQLISSTPIFNYALLKKLKETYDLDLNYHYYDFEINAYRDFIDKKSHAFFFSVKEHICLLKCKAAKLYRSNLLYLNQGELYVNPVIEAIFGEKSGKEEEKEKVEPIVTTYPFLAKAYDFLASDRCVNMVFSNGKLESNIIKHITLEHINQGQVVSIFSNDEDHISHYSEDQDFKSLLFKPEGHRNYIIDLLESEKEVFKEPESNNEVLENYLSSLKSRDESFNWPFEQNREEFLEQLANYSALGQVKYKFDIGCYTDEEYSKDREFFHRFAKLSSMKDISIYDHPFYGLTSRADNDTYKELQKIVSSCLENIDEFSSKIKQSNLNQWKFGDIDSFYDYTKIHKHFDVLRQYSGFNPKYFDLDLSSIDMESLSKLKSLYDSDSSLKLAVDNMTNFEIWSQDLSSLSAAYNGKGKVRRKAIKQAISMLKIGDKKNVSSLFRLIDIHLKNLQDIDSCKKQFEGLDINLSTIDEIVELESAVEYLELYHRHCTLYDDIEFEDNELVKRYFNDSEFREEFNDNIIDKLDDLAGKLQVEFDNIYSYFDAAEKRDYEVMSFVDVKRHLMLLRDTSYEMYLDYYNFVSYLNTVSVPLAEVINSLIANHMSFKNLEVDFFASIFAAYKKKSFDSASDSFSSLRELKTIYKKSIDEKMQQNVTDLLREIHEHIEEYKDSTTYRAFVKDAKKLALHINSPRNDELIKKFQDVVFKLKPLMVGRKSSYLRAYNKTDLSIIFDPESYSTIDLLLILALSRRVIFVSHREDESVKLGLNSVLLRNVMKTCNIGLKEILEPIVTPAMGEHLFNLIEYNANSLGYQLVKDYEYNGDIYPLVLIHPGVKKPRVLLFNDITLNEDFASIVNNVFPVIHSVYDVECVEFPLFISALSPKTVLKDILIPSRRGSTEVKETEEVNEISQEEKVSEDISHIASVSYEKQRELYEERLNKIRSSFIKRPLYNPEEEVERDDIDGYIFAVLPVSVEDYQTFKPIMKEKFNGYYRSGLIIKMGDHFFPKNLEMLTLRPGLKDLSKLTDYELRKAVFTYLSNFTYMNKKELVKILADVIETDDIDALDERVDLIIADLLKKDMICIDGEKVSLYKAV